MKSLYGAVQLIANRISENKDFLTDLDREIGDADHGTNMDRGFSAVMQALDSSEQNDSTSLKKIGMTLLSKVGGASGPLYGTVFLNAAKVEKDLADNELTLFTKRLEAGIDGVMQRGKAIRGEKTMLDAMIPALESLKSSIDSNESLEVALNKACEVAKNGVEWTKSVRATKGRASYLGDRSIGHQDPGATSFLIILEAIRDYVIE